LPAGTTPELRADRAVAAGASAAAALPAGSSPAQHAEAAGAAAAASSTVPGGSEVIIAAAGLAASTASLARTEADRLEAAGLPPLIRGVCAGTYGDDALCGAALPGLTAKSLDADFKCAAATCTPAECCEVAIYTKIPGSALHASNDLLRSHQRSGSPKTSPKECIDKCASTGGCASFDYTIADEQCSLSTSSKTAGSTYGDDGALAWFTSAAHDYYEMKVPTPCEGKAPSMGCPEIGHAITGENDWPDLHDFNNAAEAVAACVGKPGCKSVDWKTAEGWGHQSKSDSTHAQYKPNAPWEYYEMETW
jgi:hypothetical protein